MPTVLTSIDDLMARHQARFAAVLQYAQSGIAEAGKEQFDEAVEMFSGEPGQVQGDARPGALREADHPFAWRHGNPLWNTPKVGIITGDLLASIAFDVSSVGSVYSTRTYSAGVAYAPFLLAWKGTETMLPRGVSQHMQEWSIMRLQRLGQDIMSFQRSLI